VIATSFMLIKLYAVLVELPYGWLTSCFVSRLE
jgi:hypothetical protein